MSVDLNKLKTEGRNPNTMDIDTLDTLSILKKINDEDKTVAFAVEKEISHISCLVDNLVESFLNNGRLIYMGAGTSGRVGIIDAVECHPTFGVSFEMVQCLMAGGKDAFIQAVEGAEDNKELAKTDLEKIGLNSHDFVIGLAASGRTPYVIGGIEYAKKIGAKTGCVVTTPNSIIASMVDYPICVETKEEVITGSTRMKAGTAQKMVCNMITTTSMIKLGKVYENLMVDVLPTNEKLVFRSYKIISEATGLSTDDAMIKLNEYKSIKKVIFSELSGIKDIKKINYYLDKNNGHIRNALLDARKEEI